MKRIIYIALALVCCSSLQMCTKSELSQTKEQVTIGVTINDTKVALTQGEKKLALAWESDDCLRVVGQTNELYQIEAGFSDHYAKFTGNSAGTGAKTVFYPGTYADVTALKARSYTTQEQDGNGSTAHLEFNALAEGVTNLEEVEFNTETGKINQAVKFVVKLPAGITKVTSLIIEAPSNLFYTTNGGTEMTNKIALGLKNVDVSTADQVLTAYMMMSWQEMSIPSGTAFTIKVLTPTTSEACCHQLVATTNKAYSWVGGQTFVFDMSSKELVHELKGAGTKESPYLIYDVTDLLLANECLTAGKMTYCKLMADIDMSSVTNWSPKNQSGNYDVAIDFNGNNHKIRNFTCKPAAGVYAGFVGVLNGNIYDVSFDKADIAGTKAAGVVCGYAGTKVEGVTANIRNVNVTNSTVTENGNAPAGSIFGNSSLVGLILKDLYAEKCTVKLSSSAKVTTTGAAIGGIGGQTTSATIDNCQTKDVTVSGCRLVGGVIGYASRADVVTNCHAINVTITTSSINAVKNESIGGVLGYMDSGTIANCSSTGTLSGINQLGGIVGSHAPSISNCWSKMTITTTLAAGKTDYDNVAGIIGYANTNCVVDKCWSECTITGRQGVGGIIGTAGKDKTITIKNCYSKGTIAGGTQHIGGIIGEGGPGLTVTNCYSIASISSRRVLGGIVGRACAQSWTAEGTDAVKSLTISGCIAWQTALDVTASIENSGSSAAIVGFTSVKNILSNCWRNPVMTTNSGKESNNKPVDQDDCDGTNWSSTTTPGLGGDQNNFPYWGKAAAADATASSVAKALGWDETIWDLSGNEPKLK